MSKKGIYKLDVSVGRMGDLDGVFVATKEQVDTLINDEIIVYFGEVLGKHSEVYGGIEKHEIKFITNDKVVVDLFVDNDLSNGFDPFDYTTTGFDFEKWGLSNDDDEHSDDSVREVVDMIIKTRKKDKK